MEENKVVESQEMVAKTNMFEDMCPFDFEQMEIITIEHGLEVWHCPVCDYIRPVNM